MIKEKAEDGYLICIPKVFHGYRCIRKIGFGTTSIVELVEDQNTGKRYSAKIASKPNINKRNLTKLIEKEIAILDVMDHPHVIKMKENLEIKNKYGEHFIVIITEYCENGDLISYLYKFKSTTDLQKKKIFISILKAIKYLHSLGISHGDIKAENIILTKHNNAKLCDFGFCRTIFVAHDESKYGTLYYAAPELYITGDFDPFKADIYAIGMTLYLSFELQFPFRDGDQDYIIDQTIKGNLTFDPKMDKQLNDLVVWCLNVDPKKRPTVDEILNHKFFDIGEKKYPSKNNNYYEKNNYKTEICDQSSISSASLGEKYYSPNNSSYDSNLKI
ncbi:Serine/threonine-protein kinase brsk1 [Tritrichomonas musculus]|uniref:Serine/threonine-protein kinase brsk1 n=1 Tax=Tritrichomonas musculus TaxID=1915356 RepID=A0ABR2JFF6_9EUKA